MKYSSAFFQNRHSGTAYLMETEHGELRVSSKEFFARNDNDEPNKPLPLYLDPEGGFAIRLRPRKNSINKDAILDNWRELKREERRINRKMSNISWEALFESGYDIPGEDGRVSAEEIVFSDALKSVYDELSEKEKLITSMKMEGFKSREIAEVLGCTRENVEYWVKKISARFMKVRLNPQ